MALAQPHDETPKVLALNPKLQQPPAVRDISDDEYVLLPAIEDSADPMFHSIGIHGLPGAGDPEQWRAAEFVLVADDPPVGFVVVTEVDGQAHLEQASVHVAHSRLGIGARLIAAARARATSLGYSRMSLLTYAAVPWNAPYYRRLGFEVLTDLGPGLQGLREHEIAIGLDKHGERVAMAFVL